MVTKHKTLIIYTHPNPKSFNFAILSAIQEELAGRGHEVRVRDLYSEPFKAVLDTADFVALAQGQVPEDIAREQELIKWAEALIFIYPVWWFERPALLKGWIDRVFTKGFAFNYSAEGAKGLLTHKKALVIQTAGNTDEELARNNVLEVIQRPMTEGTLQFCGITDVKCKTFAAVAKGGAPRNDEMLREVREVLLRGW